MSRPVCVITGGSRGIGAATARRAAAAGYHVVLSYVSAGETAAAVAAEVGGTAVRADVAVESDMVDLFGAAASLGEVTAVVANAGIVAAPTTVVDLDRARLERMFAVNALGAFFTAREAVRTMSRSRGSVGGSLVFVGSIASRIGSPSEYVDYAASKAAVDTLTLGLAKEVAGDGIRVNCVRPGVIDTDIHASGGQPGRAQRIGETVPLGRPGTADEIANTIVWLLSDEASYLTGALIDVGGGR